MEITRPVTGPLRLADVPVDDRLAVEARTNALARGFAVSMSLHRRTLVDTRVADAIAAEKVRRVARRRFAFRRPVMLAIGLLVVSGLATAVGAGTGIVRLEGAHTPAEINAEIAAAMQTTSVPPGYTFPPLHVPEDGSIWGSYNGQGLVEFNAMCAWYRNWTVAFAQGDQNRMASDRAMMDEILTWRTIADPFLADDSVRNGLRGLNARVDAGDPKPIKAWLAQCSTP